MSSNTTRVVAGIAVVIVAAVLFVVLRDGSDDEPLNLPNGAPTTAQEAGEVKPKKKPAPIPTIVVEHGAPVGGVKELSYDSGEQIRFKVESDIAEEIHVHGYDISKEVAAGGSVEFDFPASIEGVFEAELEAQGVQIAELTVNP
jgi:hypothetical protein